MAQRLEDRRTIPLLKLDEVELLVIGGALSRIANGKVSEGAFFVGFVYSGWIKWTNGDVALANRWLSKLPTPSRYLLKEMARYAEAIQISKASIRSEVTDNGVNLGVEVTCEPEDNKAVLAYMIVALLSAGYGNNLRICPFCDKWFFDIPKGRPMRKFCTSKHSNAYRAQVYRDEHKS